MENQKWYVFIIFHNIDNNSDWLRGLTLAHKYRVLYISVVNVTRGYNITQLFEINRIVLILMFPFE